MKKFENKISFKSPLVIAVGLLFASVMTYLIAMSLAAVGPATMYASPGGNQTVNVNSTFSVSVRIATASNVPVSAGSSELAYPADKIQVIGINYSGSAYGLQAAESNAPGLLRMDRAALPAVSGGDKLFATVTFKAIAGGSAGISFTNRSVVSSGENDSNILSARNGVTYNIATPAAAAPPPNSSPAPTPPPSSPPPSRPSSTAASPPPGSAATTTSSPSASDTSPSPPNEGSNPAGQPAQVNQSDNITKPQSAEGKILLITVLDKDKQPVVGAKVLIDGQTMETNESGTAEFVGISSGGKSVEIQYNGRKFNKKVDVEASVLGVADTQAVNLLIEDDDGMSIIPIIVAPLILMLVAVIVIFGQRLKAGLRFPTLHPQVINHNTGRPVISGSPSSVNEVKNNPIDSVPYPQAPKPGNTIEPEKK